MTDPLDHLRRELGLEEPESDEVFEKQLDELDHILEAREQTAALTFNWKEGMETSLNSLYEEWPMLLRWIPFFQALVETVQAYLAFRGAGTVDRSEYLKQVSSLADSIFSSEGVKGTNKELLARQKIGTLGEKLKKATWLNQAQVDGELKRILKEIQSDLSHEESYSTIQLIFQEAKQIDPKIRWSWINEQIQGRIESNTQLWTALCAQTFTNNPLTFDQEARAVLRLADPKTQIESEQVSQLFSRSLLQLSPFQPVTQQELNVFIHIVGDPILPLLQTNLAKDLLVEHLGAIAFSDFSTAHEEVRNARGNILKKIQPEFERLIPAEFSIKLKERAQVNLNANTREAYILCLADDLHALLDLMPEGEKRDWLYKALAGAMQAVGEDYNQMRKNLLENLPMLYAKQEKNPLQQDLENLERLLSDEVVGRKVLFFIRGRAIPVEEQISFFMSKETANKRLNEGIAQFCKKNGLSEEVLREDFAPLFNFIKRSEKVDRVLFDYLIEIQCSKIFEDNETLGNALRDSLMYFPPSGFEIHDIIQRNVGEVVSVLED